MEKIDLKSTVLGIELGSTRVKAVLMDDAFRPIASGSQEWENQLKDGIWTYSMDLVHSCVQACYADLVKDVQEKFGVQLTNVGAIGVSAMMHGYLPFDKDGKQLTEFRTWRNTITGAAAEALTESFQFNIPQRWSIAHLYQAVLNQEAHLPELGFVTTLAGYIHWLLTGEKVLGVGDASGVFPIDSDAMDYDAAMVEKFDALCAPYGYSWKLLDVLPKVLPAGAVGGCLSEAGAKFLDPTGVLQSGIPVAPPEGDAGTGMAATNSVRVKTGNVSAGTSDFAMVVVDHALGVHREIDMVTTPSGFPVAMVHCNNCTSDINAWGRLFAEFAQMLGVEMDWGDLLQMLFRKSLEGDKDCGGLISYNYFSGEGVTDLDEGRPLLVRTPDARFNMANFMRTHILSAFATLKIGLDILTEQEKVEISRIYGHGGIFKTPEVAQRALSAALDAPVSIMKTAGEGGPYGMALLAAYMIWKQEGETLEDYLEQRVFAAAEVSELMADQDDVEGYRVFLQRYQAALPVEKAAIASV